MSYDDLGDRMKAYEARETERRFLPMLPVYARIDGRCFSSFTKNFARPFDPSMIDAMIRTTAGLVERTHAKIGYTQSDEISLVWLGDRYDSGSIFFGGKVMKMASVLAGLATVLFCREMPAQLDRLPHFDCRVFQLPNKTEAANVFLWRERDATKNAVSMAARTIYSHKELDGKKGSQMQEMLFEKGINFNDYPSAFKRGTFVRRATVQRAFTDAELSRIPEQHRPSPDATCTRSEIVPLAMPKFATVINREAVIFDGAEPAIAQER